MAIAPMITNLQFGRRLAWCLMLILSGLASPLSTAKVEPLDRIVAIVDDDVVLLSELRAEIDRLQLQLRQAQATAPPPDRLKQQALERLVLSKLQLAAAQSSGLSVDDNTLAAAIQNIADKNQLTLPQLQEELANEGIDFAAFRENLRQQILISRLRAREVIDRIQVTPGEIDAFLARGGEQASGRTDYHLLHILIATPDGASPAEVDNARQRAEGILAKLRGGADFQALAQTQSDGRQAFRGGDLGWLNSNRVPSLFADAAATLERGGLAGPIRSASGFHIIKLEDYKGSDRQIVAQTHARHILIRTDELTSDLEAKERLTRLRERIIGGDDFATLARSHSDDRGSALKGGDLGWINPGNTLPRFAAEMDRLEPGAISEVFRTDFGWHILQVLERRNHDATDEVKRANAYNLLRDRKSEEAIELYLRRLRDEAYVELQLEDPYE